MAVAIMTGAVAVLGSVPAAHLLQALTVVVLMLVVAVAVLSLASQPDMASSCGVSSGMMTR